MQKYRPEDLHGIHAIVYALFDADERLDRAAMRRQVQACLSCGVHGMAALGLGTEGAKLTEGEGRTGLGWGGGNTAGEGALGVHILGAAVAEQTAQLRHAQQAGADWVILQPPTVGTFSAAEYIRFFGRVAQA